MSEDVVKALSGILILLAEGNPGALTILMRIFKNYSPQVAALVFHTLKVQGVSGSAVWERYKDGCKEDLDAFVTKTLAEKTGSES